MSLSGKKKAGIAEGAWEEPGVIGTRIEIEGRKMTVLWRNSPVLETTFRTKTAGDLIELIPASNELSYTKGGPAYATVVSLVVDGDSLIFTEHFPVTGQSTERLKRTEDSRYGNYDFADNIIPELQGEWSTEDGSVTATVSGDVMTFGGVTKRIRILAPKNGGSYRIATDNPAEYEFGYFTRPEYSGGVISAYEIILDGPSVRIELKAMPHN